MHFSYNTHRKMPIERDLLPYPFSYFTFGISQALSQRFGLNWFNWFFTSIFWLACLWSLLPSEQFSETYPLETFIDDVYTPLTDSVVQDLAANAKIVDGKLRLIQVHLLIGFYPNRDPSSSNFLRKLLLNFWTWNSSSKCKERIDSIRYRDNDWELPKQGKLNTSHF